MIRRLTTTLSVVGIALYAGYLAAGEPPRVIDLRTQKVEGTTYFHVRLERPADLRLSAFDTGKPFSESDRRKFARLPRLVPQDRQTRAVCYRHKPAQPGLSFCGQVTGDGKAGFVLTYPTRETPFEKPPPLAELVRSPGTAEVPVELDFTKAWVVPVPAVDPEDQHVHRDDLRGLWALHQAAHFAVLETQVLDFPFYSFAREATGRKYGVVAPAWVRRQVSDPEHRLYEVTTGADALAEALQLHRLLQPEAAEGVRQETARRFLGFVPVSPDGSPYRYDARLGEVVNGRHGSHRRPDLHGRVAAASELGRLLDQVKALHAELRFLDNGLHTVLTIERR